MQGKRLKHHIASCMEVTHRLFTLLSDFGACQDALAVCCLQDALDLASPIVRQMAGNNKGEVNHIRRIVLACERDMEDLPLEWGSVALCLKC